MTSRRRSVAQRQRRRPFARRSGLAQDAGAVAVVVALVVSTILFGVAAFSVDLGNTLSRRVDLQGIADDAARAGAAQLPDATLAAAAVLTNLCAVPQPQTGWDYAGCSAAPVTGPAQNGTATVVEVTDDEGNTSGANFVATRITVTPPPLQVDFSFGGAVGVDGVPLTVKSTAAIGTPSGLGVLPYYLTPDDFFADDVPHLDTSVSPAVPVTPLKGSFQRGAGGHFCMSIGRRSVGPPCPSGERGELNVPRYKLVSSNPITPNTRLGLQVVPHDWSRWKLAGSIRAVDVGANTECAAAGATVSPTATPSPYVVDVNCLTTIQSANDFTERDAFFGTATSRGNRVCPGGQTGTIGGSGAADETDLFGTTLLDDSKRVAAGVTVDLETALTTNADTPAPGWIRSRIFSCGRLALLPVLDGRVPVNSGKSYPVLGFAYVWIDKVDEEVLAASDDHGYLFSGIGRLIGLEGYVLPRWYFPTLVTDSPTVIPYLGRSWPKQVVLVK